MSGVLSKKAISITFAVTLTSTLLTYQNCAQMRFSSSEQKVLGENPFSFNPNDFVAGVDAIDGTVPTENLRVKTVEEAAQHFVKDCSVAETYEIEKEQALQEARADITGKTIPVAYAVSYGLKEDILAHWAHKRAILSKDNAGKTFIPVGAKTSPHHNGGHLYYSANHDKAKIDYIKGDKCFFNTVKIVGQTVQPGGERYDFIGDIAQKHTVHYMYFGWCSGADCAPDGNYGNDKFANRLFQEAGPKQEPQIVKLYVADIRENQLALGTHNNPVINVPEDMARGRETIADLKDLIDLDVVYQNLGKGIRNLSSDRTVGGILFSELVGVPQLLHNLLLAGETGTVMPSQYTPIALDLGEKKVVTSSVNWGSFFNMAALENLGLRNTDKDVLYVPHKTAWLGGKLIDVKDQVNDGRNFKIDVRRAVSDGFLVIPDADGKVRSSKNMFGDHTVVDGKTYENGFLALQAFAKKNCESEEIKDRYFGPWDAELYGQVKVWTDSNKNGIVNDGEVKSLVEAGVVAVSSCNIVHNETEDSFGNGTHLRSAFLFHSGKDVLSEEEILKRITTGETSDGTEAEFRLAIDLIFKTRPDVLLKKYPGGLKGAVTPLALAK